MTRSTATLDRIADPELSPSAALRILRSIAFPQSAVYQAPVQADPNELCAPEPFEDSPAPVAVAPTFTLTPSRGLRTWYLNEVPAGWLDSFSTEPSPAA